MLDITIKYPKIENKKKDKVDLKFLPQEKEESIRYSLIIILKNNKSKNMETSKYQWAHQILAYRQTVHGDFIQLAKNFPMYLLVENSCNLFRVSGYVYSYG